MLQSGRLSRVAALTAWESGQPGPAVASPSVLLPSRAVSAAIEGSGRIGRFCLGPRLGGGGMGVVYAAVDEETGQEYAIKILRNTPQLGPIDYQRFQQEAQIGSRLQHPNIVRVFSMSYARNDIPFLVMERVYGVDLAQFLTVHGKLLWPVVVDLLQQIGSGLHAAHQAGILHRDIKPSNILINRRNIQTEIREDWMSDAALAGRRTAVGALVAKLTDFGISKILDAAPTGLTHRGQIVGTPEYLSPEATMGARLDRRSDIWALGVVAYQLLTGRVPFWHADSLRTLLKIRYQPLPELRTLAPDVPRHVVAVVEKALAKRPEQRFATVAELVEALCGRACGGPAWGAPAAIVTGASLSQGPASAEAAAVPSGTAGRAGPSLAVALTPVWAPAAAGAGGSWRRRLAVAAGICLLYGVGARALDARSQPGLRRSAPPVASAAKAARAAAAVPASTPRATALAWRGLPSEATQASPAPRVVPMVPSDSSVVPGAASSPLRRPVSRGAAPGSGLPSLIRRGTSRPGAEPRLLAAPAASAPSSEARSEGRQPAVEGNGAVEAVVSVDAAGQADEAAGGLTAGIAPSVPSPQTAASPRLRARFVSLERLAGDDPRLPLAVLSSYRGQTLDAIYQVCVTADGRVQSVHVKRGILDLDTQIVAAIKTWRYPEQPEGTLTCTPESMRFDFSY